MTTAHTRQQSESSVLSGDDTPIHSQSSPSSENGRSGELSRSGSFSGSIRDEDWESMAQFDRLTLFDLLDNIALPSLALNQRIDKWNKSLQSQSEQIKKQSRYVKETYQKQKEKVLKKKDTELERFKRKYGDGVDKLMVRWEDQKVGLKKILWDVLFNKTKMLTYLYCRL